MMSKQMHGELFDERGDDKLLAGFGRAHLCGEIMREPRESFGAVDGMRCESDARVGACETGAHGTVEHVSGRERDEQVSDVRAVCADLFAGRGEQCGGRTQFVCVRFICPTQCTLQQTEDVVSLSRFARPPCWPIRMQ